VHTEVTMQPNLRAPKFLSAALIILPMIGGLVSCKRAEQREAEAAERRLAEESRASELATRAAPSASAAATGPARAAGNPPVSATRGIAAPFVARSGAKLTGTANLSEVDGGVRVMLQLANLEPGKKGAHIHEKADCSSADAKTAGSHYNPSGHPHGLPPAEARHLGDLGNILANSDGTAQLDVVVPGATLSEGAPNSLVGRSVVVHAGEDIGAQPDGGAGARIGCAEIRAERVPADAAR
jgi:Cu-Zn family superoxide dismutase